MRFLGERINMISKQFQWVSMVMELKEIDSRKITVGKRYQALLDLTLFSELFYIHLSQFLLL